MRHFLDLKDFTKDELTAMLHYGIALRQNYKLAKSHHHAFAGKYWHDF